MYRLTQWKEDIAAQHATLARLGDTLRRMEDAEQELEQTRATAQSELTLLRNRAGAAEKTLQVEREARRRELAQAKETASAEVNILRSRILRAEADLVNERAVSQRSAAMVTAERQKTADAQDMAGKAQKLLGTEREVYRRYEEKVTADQQREASARMALQQRLDTATAPLNAEISKLSSGAVERRDQFRKTLAVVELQLSQARDDLRAEREQHAQEADREQRSGTSRTNVLQSQLAAAQAALHAQQETNGRLEARAAQIRTAAEEEAVNLRRQLATAANFHEAEQARMKSRTLDLGQAIADANNRATALEFQLTTQRDETEKVKAMMHSMSARLTAATGELAAEKAGRLKERQHSQEVRETLERQIAAKEDLRLTLERRVVALSHKP